MPGTRRPRYSRPARDATYDSQWIYVHSSDTSREHTFDLTGVCWCDPYIESVRRDGSVLVLHEGCGIDA